MQSTGEEEEVVVAASYPWQDENLRDFRNFLYLIWKHLKHPDPTPLQYDIAQYLQHGPRRLVIEAFRGQGKTWITVAFVLWTLYWNPHYNILVVSASKPHADNFSHFCKQLLQEVEWLAPLLPRGEQRDRSDMWDVGPAPAAHAPSVKSVGITGQITGSRADLIVADDVEVPKNSATVVMREKLAELIKEFDAILKPGGRTTYLGTPQSEESIYTLLEPRGYSVRIWPAQYPDAKLAAYYGQRLSPLLLEHLASGEAQPGDPTDPIRFNSEDLLDRQASYGRSGYALQFMLDTSRSDANRFPLKLADLIVMDLDAKRGPNIKPIWASSKDLVINDLDNYGYTGDHYHSPLRVQGDYIPYRGVVMAIDPSGRGKDELGVSVVANIDGTLYLLANRGLVGGYIDSNLQSIAELAKQFEVNHVVVEENYGDGMFSKLLTPFLRKVHPVAIEEIKHSKQKEARIIDTLEPVLNQHRLVVCRSVIAQDSILRSDVAEHLQKQYCLFYQLTHIERVRGCLLHDDRLDSLAMAVAYWAQAMGVDQDRAVASRAARAMDEEVRKFLREVDGRSSRRKEGTWLSSNAAFG